MRIQAGKMVCLEYALFLADGTPIDSTTESGIWTYVHGHTKMPPGLAKGLEGLGVDDHVRLTLTPEEAFGPIDPAAFLDVPRASVPSSAQRVGFAGELPGPDGSLIPYQVHAIHADTVTFDLNHPLAGQHVVFEVTVVHIQD
ncbi:MAG TPA: FKBP-type peptidyl-prolyl cis-trans isomerase [Candidatus Tectomicrobia bacterium]